MSPDKSNVRRTSPFWIAPETRLTELTRRDSWQCGTSNADIDQDDVSLAGVLQVAVGRAVTLLLFHPSVRAFHIQLAKRTSRTSTNVASHLLSFYQLQKIYSPCATRWFGSHCLQSGAWASPLFPTRVPSCQQYPVLVKIASHSVPYQQNCYVGIGFLKFSPCPFIGVNKIIKWLFVFEKILE